MRFDLDLTKPEPAEGLIAASAAQEVVLFAFAGLGTRTAMPTWTPFVEQLLEWDGAHGFLSGEALVSARTSIQEGYADSIVDAIVTAADPAMLHAFVGSVFARDVPQSDAHALPGTIPCGAALTISGTRRLRARIGFTAIRPSLDSASPGRGVPWPRHPQLAGFASSPSIPASPPASRR